MKKILVGLSIFLAAGSSYSEVILKFTRADAFIGIASDARIFLNEEQVGKISNGGSLKVSTTAGLKLIKVDARFVVGEFKKSFDLQEDSTYEIQVGPRLAAAVFSLFGGLGLLADNIANRDSEGSDNGMLTVNKFEKVSGKKENSDQSDLLESTSTTTPNAITSHKNAETQNDQTEK